MPGLGRIHQPDARDLAHLMARHIDTAVGLPASRHWPAGPILDQGDTPQCTAYSWRAHLNADPNQERGKGPDAPTLYGEEKQVDGLPGVDGSTVRAGAQVLRQQGLIDEYVWAFDEPTMRAWVLGHGPVAFGSNWYEGMFSPDGNGMVRIGGDVAGGHAFLCIGLDTASDLYHFQNSWGASWGQGGFFYMDAATVARLLSEDGEACTVLNLNGGTNVADDLETRVATLEQRDADITKALNLILKGQYEGADGAAGQVVALQGGNDDLSGNVKVPTFS